VLSVVNSTLICDFVAQSVATAGDEDDLAIQIRDGVSIKVTRVEIIDDPPHWWQVTVPEQDVRMVAAGLTQRLNTPKFWGAPLFCLAIVHIPHSYHKTSPA